VAEIQSELSIIADETARCGNIVKNLLLFSRQKVGEFVEEDIRATIDRSLKLIDHHLKMHNIKLEKDYESEPLMLFCDPQQIEQALLAIEINAVEAMPDDGTLRVAAHRLAGSDSVRMTISDTGIGIPEEALTHIFEPFFTTKENGKGTGLGLAVVYGIVERHAGSINVQSKLHVGSTFTITLPRLQAEAPHGATATSLQY
jgi:two-component system NtrC family sensor kinase